jgi:hypothetical protein
MTFLELQDAVLSDRFAESKRDEAKRWINYRYARIWAQEAWNFKLAAITPTIAYPDSSVSLSSMGLQRIHGVWDSSTLGTTNRNYLADRPEDFYNWTSTVGGRGYGFSVIGGVLKLDRPVTTATNLIVLGELEFEPLVADSDVPLLPEGFHNILVHGGSSEGLREENDPTWQGFEQDYQAGLVDLKAGYLTAIKTAGDAFPSWP